MLGGFTSRGVQDADDDGHITAEEVRGAHYAKRVRTEVYQPTVVFERPVNTKRYTASQERAIARLMHSRAVWARYAEEDEANKEQKAAEARAAAEEAAADEVDSGAFSVWTAARLGKVEQVKQYVALL